MYDRSEQPHIEATAQLTEQLPASLRTTLALLNTADDKLIELTLGTLPLGSRTTLAALGFVELCSGTTPDAPVAVTLTDRGREAIVACAVAGMPHDVDEQLAALEEARAEREAADATTDKCLDHFQVVR